MKPNREFTVSQWRTYFAWQACARGATLFGVSVAIGLLTTVSVFANFARRREDPLGIFVSVSTMLVIMAALVAITMIAFRVAPRWLRRRSAEHWDMLCPNCGEPFVSEDFPAASKHGRCARCGPQSVFSEKANC